MVGDTQFHRSSFKSVKDLKKLHDHLCHLGVMKLVHYYKLDNIPFSPTETVLRHLPKSKCNLLLTISLLEKFSLDIVKPLFLSTKSLIDILIYVDGYNLCSFPL